MVDDAARREETQPWQSPHVARLAPNATWSNTTMCALVLEYAPVPGDSRLVFDAFPFHENMEESYSLAAYQEHGGNVAPQPTHVNYKGGSWGDINLVLKFRTGIKTGDGGRMSDPNAMWPYTLNEALIAMERKVNWCMALGFRLERPDAWQQFRTLNIPTAATSRGMRRRWQNAKRRDPPMVLLVIGSWKIIRGYITNIAVTWEPPWHPISGRPYGATVRLQMKPLLRRVPNWEYIRYHGNNAGADSKYLASLEASEQGSIGKGPSTRAMERRIANERFNTINTRTASRLLGRVR